VDLGGPKKQLLNWGPDPHMRKGNFEGGKGRPIVSVGSFCRELCKTAERIEMPFSIWTQVDPRKHVLDEVLIGAT